MRNTILSLCDLSGVMVEPWVKNGYKAVLIDPQHRSDSDDGTILRLGRTIEDSFTVIEKLISDKRIAFVSSFPPCTDMAVSGARWFESKYSNDHLFQAKAVDIAEQCRMIGICSGQPFFVENPVSVLSSVFGKPNYTFSPYYYTKYCPEDNYNKKTCLWTGNGFIMPTPSIDETLGYPDDRIHMCPPGPERQNIRSKTPYGFAMAVFKENGNAHVRN